MNRSLSLVGDFSGVHQGSSMAEQKLVQSRRINLRNPSPKPAPIWKWQKSQTYSYEWKGTTAKENVYLFLLCYY